MDSYLANNVLMVKPINFYFDKETAATNFYQKKGSEAPEVVEEKAKKEFDDLVNKLLAKGINVKVLEDSAQPFTPDSIFPNNWFISDEAGKITVCPMCAPNRRHEREKFLGGLINFMGNDTIEINNLTMYEAHKMYLEGTGAIVLDRKNKIAYTCLSSRSDRSLFKSYCEKFGYREVSFNAYQVVADQREKIYHTNVMMALGLDFAVICLDSLFDDFNKFSLRKDLKESGKTVIDLTVEQTNNFAGNILQLRGLYDKVYTVMSTSAYNAYTKEQLAIIEKSSEIITADINTIETYGGGSVRCMIAEVF